MKFLTVIFILIAFLPAHSETPSDKIKDSIVHRICAGLKRVAFDKNGVNKVEIGHQRMKDKGMLPSKEDEQAMAFLKQLLQSSMADVKEHEILYFKRIGSRFDSKLCKKVHVKKK